MEANELRLGNYVFDGLGNLTEVTAKMIVEQHQSDIASCIYLQPIPLTEQWLIDFGFEKVNSSSELHLKKGFFHWYSSTKSIVLEFDSGINGDCYDFFLDDNCDKVHQLQNLYFSLTGEELKK